MDKNICQEENNIKKLLIFSTHPNVQTSNLVFFFLQKKKNDKSFGIQTLPGKQMVYEICCG